MFTNATLTLYDGSTGFDAVTGLKNAATATTICEDEPCLFSPSRGARRQVYAHGQQQVMKPAYPILLPNLSIDVRPGQTAVVTCAGIVQTFTVNDAVPASGIVEDHWELDVERVKSPA